MFITLLELPLAHWASITPFQPFSLSGHAFLLLSYSSALHELKELWWRKYSSIGWRTSALSALSPSSFVLCSFLVLAASRQHCSPSIAVLRRLSLLTDHQIVSSRSTCIAPDAKENLLNCSVTLLLMQMSSTMYLLFFTMLYTDRMLLCHRSRPALCDDDMVQSH